MDLKKPADPADPAPAVTRRRRLWRALRGYFGGRLGDVVGPFESSSVIRRQRRRHLKELLQAAAPATAAPNPPPATRTWAGALAYYQWPPALLRRRYREHAPVVRVMFLAAVVSLGSAGYRLGVGDGGGCLASLGVTLILLSLGLRPAYRCWAIRHRTLGAFPYFLRHPLAWWPPRLPDDYQP